MIAAMPGVRFDDLDSSLRLTVVSQPQKKKTASAGVPPVEVEVGHRDEHDRHEADPHDRRAGVANAGDDEDEPEGRGQRVCRRHRRDRHGGRVEEVQLIGSKRHPHLRIRYRCPEGPNDIML